MRRPFSSLSLDEYRLGVSVDGSPPRGRYETRRWRRGAAIEHAGVGGELTADGRPVALARGRGWNRRQVIAAHRRGL